MPCSSRQPMPAQRWRAWPGHPGLDFDGFVIGMSFILPLTSLSFQLASDQHPEPLSDGHVLTLSGSSELVEQLWVQPGLNELDFSHHLEAYSIDSQLASTAT